MGLLGGDFGKLFEGTLIQPKDPKKGGADPTIGSTVRRNVHEPVLGPQFGLPADQRIGDTGQPQAPGTITGSDIIADLLNEEKRRQRVQDALTRIEEKRARDLASGTEFIKDFSMGTIADEDRPLKAENEQLRKLLQDRLGGLTSGEGAALRETAFRGLNQRRQGDIRALRGLQGGQGIRGPAAVAQQQDVFRQSADRASDLEQQLLQRNIDIQRQAAGDFQSEIGRQQTQDLGIQQFNIAQADREAALKKAFPFAFAGLGAQEHGAAASEVSGFDTLIASILGGNISPQDLQGALGGTAGIPAAPGGVDTPFIPIGGQGAPPIVDNTSTPNIRNVRARDFVNERPGIGGNRLV